MLALLQAILLIAAIALEIYFIILLCDEQANLKWRRRVVSVVVIAIILLLILVINARGEENTFYVFWLVTWCIVTLVSLLKS